MDGGQPQASGDVLTLGEVEKLTAITNQVNSIIKGLREGSFLDALKRVHQIVKENMELLGKAPETLQALEQVEYALAYNSLVDGADPSEVRANVLGDVWQKILDSGIILDIAKYSIANSIAEGDFEQARRYIERYGQYLSRDVAPELGILVSGEMAQLVSAVNSENPEQLYKTIRRLEDEGKYEQYKQVASKYLDLNLDELRRLAYRSHIFSVLGEAESLDEAYQKLSAVRSIAEGAGLQDLLQDLDHARAALERAGAGDVSGFVDEAAGIRDSVLLRYVLAMGASVVTPEAVAGLSEERKAELQDLLSRAGFDVRVEDIEVIARAYEAAAEIGRLIRGGKPEEALQLLHSLDGGLRDVVAAMMGMSVGDLERALETAAFAKRTAGEAGKLAELLGNGSYIEAYEYWNSLSPEDRRAVAALLDVEEDNLDHAIRLAAGFQELQGLENPTLDQVRSVLAKYVGEEEADSIARELLEDSPLYQVRKLADEGKYEEALAKALREIPEEERSLAVQYILASISEAKGPEQLAQFIREHEDQLKPYLSETMLRAVQAYSQAGALAENLINVIAEEATKEYEDRLRKIVTDFEKAVSQGDFQGAEEILIRNQRLLRQAEVDGASLLDILRESLEVSMTIDWLDKAVGELEQLAGSGPDEILARIQEIRGEAEEKLQELQQAKHIDTQAKEQLSEALRRLIAYTYVLESQANLQNGRTEYALEAAEKAKQLNPDLEEYYNTIRILVMAVEDKANLARNLECILENIINIKPTTRHTARKAGGTRNLYYKHR